VTVLDTSAAIDYLLGDGAAVQVQALLADAGPAAALANAAREHTGIDVMLLDHPDRDR